MAMLVVISSFVNSKRIRGTPEHTTYLVVSVIGTLYSYSWDIYIDWGLLRSRELGKKCLRPKILYPAWFYYYAASSNFILRFFWVLGLIPSSYFPYWFLEG